MRLSFGDGYSAFVAWVKTLLPIAALGLLSTIFLFSGKVDVTQSLPYAEHNVAEIIREQRITQPYFTGISDNGTKIAISAAYASPDAQNTDILNINELSIVMEPDHARATQITAGLGTLDSSTQVAVISDNVQIAATPDFWLTTDTLIVDLKRGIATADSEFHGVTALGAIKAGKMVIEMTTNDGQIVFTNGVHLIYYPKPN